MTVWSFTCNKFTSLWLDIHFCIVLYHTTVVYSVQTNTSKICRLPAGDSHCRSIKCINGGKCQPLAGVPDRCRCRRGYSGKRCEQTGMYTHMDLYQCSLFRGLFSGLIILKIKFNLQHSNYLWLTCYLLMSFS